MNRRETTYLRQPQVKKTWKLVNAEGIPLGRLATEVAQVLMGKNKPEYTPHIDSGDYVVIINADKVHMTGNKGELKFAWHYTGYPGGLKSATARVVRAKDPEFMLREAVSGMLPKNRLSRQLIKKLKVYGGSDHPHAAQQPEPLPH